MKINWGTGIAITFTLFAGGMIFLVWMCILQPQDLVSIDYYNREIAYQQQIDKTSNTSDLSHPLMIGYDATQQTVSVGFPAEIINKQVTGTLHFFKPDNAALDFEVAVKPGQSLSQVVSASKMKSGLWHLKADWKAGANSYYQEESIVITQ